MKNDENKVTQDDEVDLQEALRELEDDQSPEGGDELVHLKNKFEEADSSYKRALADYQNLQKRVADERRNLILAANRELLLRILSVLDTLELAQKHDESEGLKVSIAQFLDVLKSEGVTRIETVGLDFDPATMEAIATDKGEEGKVLEEIRSGYILNDKFLRAAQVKVGKE